MSEITEPKEKAITDLDRNAKWDSMLKVFANIINGNPEPSKVKDKLESLKQAATTSIMTGRQQQGIVERCNNYLNGTYGVDRMKDDYAKNHKQA
jgi:hypothetical protein